MEYYIYHIPVFLVGPKPPQIDVPAFCSAAEELIPDRLLNNIDVVYMGETRELQNRNAAYHNGAIYMTDPTAAIYMPMI